MERASEALFALKPVTFRYKKGIDPQGIPQFGLVAEDVEEVNPDLVVRDKEGKVNTQHCALRGSERDVTQRVPQRTPHGARVKVYWRKAGSDYRGTKEGLPGYDCAAARGNSSPHCKPERAGIANPESERAA
jgi:hypothetical protein